MSGLQGRGKRWRTDIDTGSSKKWDPVWSESNNQLLRSEALQEGGPQGAASNQSAEESVKTQFSGE